MKFNVFAIFIFHLMEVLKDEIEYKLKIRSPFNAIALNIFSIRNL
jgi:hypothetical protein